jgi:hypothetical protein
VRTAAPGNTVHVADIERYLLTTKYYSEHPRNFRHLQESVEDGAALLPQQPMAALTRAAG